MKKELEITIQELPMVIRLTDVEGNEKQYVLKSNKDKTGMFINAIEKY